VIKKVGALGGVRARRRVLLTGGVFIRVTPEREKMHSIKCLKFIGVYSHGVPRRGMIFKGLPSLYYVIFFIKKTFLPHI